MLQEGRGAHELNREVEVRLCRLLRAAGGPVPVGRGSSGRDPGDFLVVYWWVAGRGTDLLSFRNVWATTFPAAMKGERRWGQSGRLQTLANGKVFAYGHIVCVEDNAKRFWQDDGSKRCAKRQLQAKHWGARGHTLRGSSGWRGSRAKRAWTAAGMSASVMGNRIRDREHRRMYTRPAHRG